MSEKKMHPLWQQGLQENLALKTFPFAIKNNEILGGNVRMGDLTLCSLIIPLCFRDKESGDMIKWFLWERDKLVCALTIKA